MRISRMLMAAALACAASAATAEEFDRKKVLELLPCKPAALRLCDRTQGINAGSLFRCGATLAEHAHEVNQRCVAVLRRYGQL